VPQADHDQELAFWQAATGQTLAQIDKYPEYHGSVLPGQYALLVQRLGSGQARVHLDIHTDDLEAEVARLEALGAQREAQAHPWQVMRDPAGLLFCVVPEPPGSLTADNAQRWE
jgi:hypothetical protein